MILPKSEKINEDMRGASGLHFLLHFPYAFSGHLVINTLERNGRKILFLLLLSSWTDIPPDKKHHSTEGSFDCKLQKKHFSS